MHELSDVDASTAQPQRAQPLDYAPPPQRSPSRARDLILGVIISLSMALGVGLLSFGIMVGHGQMRDTEATIAAMGAAFLTLGLCLSVLMFLLRRPQR